MNAMKLLLALGNVKGDYILAPADFRQGNARRIPSRRLWLIAAVIALSALLVGCAVACALRLRDMAFGQTHQEYYDGSSQTVTLLSIQGSDFWNYATPISKDQAQTIQTSYPRIPLEMHPLSQYAE